MPSRRLQFGVQWQTLCWLQFSVGIARVKVSLLNEAMQWLKWVMWCLASFHLHVHLDSPTDGEIQAQGCNKQAQIQGITATRRQCGKRSSSYWKRVSPLSYWKTRPSWLSSFYLGSNASKSVSERTRMTQKTGAYPSLQGLREKEVVSATTCRLRWASLATRTSKFTTHSWWVWASADIFQPDDNICD